jgi:phosphate transport system permease protein
MTGGAEGTVQEAGEDALPREESAAAGREPLPGEPPPGERFEPRRDARRRVGSVFKWICFSAVCFGVVSLAVLLVDVTVDGLRWLSWDFLNSYPSRIPERAGVKSAILGTIWMMGLTALFTFPLGVGGAIYLEEYAPDNRLTRLLQTNIANLAGVPSIVYGILGLAVFVRYMAMGRSVIAGAATLSLLILPVVIIASQEALRAVPRTLRMGAYAVGATRWQTIRGQVLPAALPGILTGTILSLSRAIGETAPLIMIGALTFIAFPPTGPMSAFTVLPIQIFNWASRPQSEFHDLAAGAIMVLLVILLAMNATAIILRNKYRVDL